MKKRAGRQEKGTIHRVVNVFVASCQQQEQPVFFSVLFVFLFFATRLIILFPLYLVHLFQVVNPRQTENVQFASNRPGISCNHLDVCQ